MKYSSAAAIVFVLTLGTAALATEPARGTSDKKSDSNNHASGSSGVHTVTKDSKSEHPTSGDHKDTKPGSHEPPKSSGDHKDSAGSHEPSKPSGDSGKKTDSSKSSDKSHKATSGGSGRI